MLIRVLTCASLAVFTLCSGAVYAQDPSGDPFGGGFSINYKAEVLSMGAQNDSLHSWAWDWLSGEDSLVLIGDGSFPESFQCGDNRDIAVGDFDGDDVDEVVVVWDRADGGVFVGIPTIDPATLAPDPGGWNLPDVPIASGVLYATPVMADVLGEIRVVAGNFYDDRALEFVLAYLAEDSTVTLTVFDVDSATLVPAAMATISDQAVNTALPELQQFGAVSRFDVAAGDIDGDGIDEVALVVNDPAELPATHLVLKIYDYDPSSHTLNPEEPYISYAANSDVDHTCLRSVLMETGNLEPDSLDEIAILDSWSWTDVDSSRIGNLHAVKLTTAMTGIDASQTQPLPSCSWHNDAGLNGSVVKMITYQGELIVGGSFTMAGGLSAHYIARWDGTSWRPLGSGINASVQGMAVFEGDLIVGGYFTEAGGVPANHLARWDGFSWEEFGGGTNGTVIALLAPDSVFAGSLFACGEFTVAGVVSANRIARWNDSAWNALGSGLNSRALEMEEYRDRIAVTGDFTTAGGSTVNYFAFWRTNNTWQGVGSGLNSYGHALEDEGAGNHYLYLGGGFTTANGYSAPYFAYYTTSGSLFPWIGGLNGPVCDILIDDGHHNLYLGGIFTTSGLNGIYRFSYDAGWWYALGSGVTDTAGTGTVWEMSFYDDDLIVGGNFDYAGGNEACNIARWDGAAWHSFESQRFISIGLAVGKIHTNGELDDIVITACRDNLGVVERYVIVYGPDTLAPPITLCQKWESTIGSDIGASEGLARSRRIIAIDDVSGNGRPDLAILVLDSVARRIAIFEPVPDAENSCIFTDMPLIGSSGPVTDNLTELVLADLDTLTVIIGPPKAYHVDSVIQPLAIIYAPPVHYDKLDDTIWDVSNRYPLPPDEPYDTYVQYYNSTSFVVTTETEMHRDWGVSVGLEAWASSGGFDVSGYLNTTYGEGFSNYGGYSEQITVGATITAKDDDQLHAVRVSYDILEYPVLRAGEVKGRIVVVSPSMTDQGWSPAKNYASLIPNHEVDNILSYSRREEIGNNPMMASGIIGDASDFYTMQAGSPSTWYLGQQRFTESSVESTWDLSVEAGVSAGYGSGFEIFGQGVEAGFEVSLDANYGVGQVSTFSTSFSETDSLHVQMGLINSSGSYSQNRQYEVTPYAYWATNGALVIDYAVRPKANEPGQDPTWWQNHYSLQDPAFILPWRLDNEKYDVNDPEENRYRTKELTFIPSYPAPGDTVLISARVHNFSLAPTSDPVKVSFYIGNPINGGVILADKNTGDTVFTACDTLGVPIPIPAQGWAIAEMTWQLPIGEEITSCQRIWALIDPLDEISPEVHDNDDWPTNNRGWKLLYVNTTNKCYDPDGDGWVAPAYRCCDALSHWDNCPDVSNSDQTDTDGDGIGDACEDAVCGDASGDFAINVGDAVYLINYIFKGGPAPDPLCVGDASGDDTINVGDAVYLINYIFKGGPAPVEPCCP